MFRLSSSGGLLSKKSYSKSYQHTKRNLLTPDECLRLKGADKNSKGEITRAGEMLIFVAGYPAIKGRQALYFQNPVFAARASIKAPEFSDKLHMLDKLKPASIKEKEIQEQKKEETKETAENENTADTDKAD